MTRHRRHPERNHLTYVVIVLAMLAATACDQSQPPESPLEDLDLVGIDFELNSLVIENGANEVVRTEGLWVYRDGESFQFDIFIIEPRATIRFSMRELGEISPDAGELALADSDEFQVGDSLLEYVAWGEGDRRLSEAASEAGLWPPDGDTVTTADDTIVLIRTDPSSTGPLAWEPSNQLD